MIYKEVHNSILLIVIMFFLVQNVFAQTDTSNGKMDGMDMSGMDMKGMDMSGMPMNSSFSLNLPMSRDGSGTSWQPDNSPVMMYMLMKGNTALMFHGAVFLRYTSQDITREGSRGGAKWDEPNWAMFMLTHKLSDKDLFSFNSMFSLDGLTESGGGYPLLFQTGESYHGIPLVDRQHPHDLFAELAVNYTHSFSKGVDANVYAGYPGEPALGPEVFMHRLSASNDPDAPIGHHWEDATHITFGVATLGIRYKIIKVEGSIFTGREPDENRFNFDAPHLDSYSFRLSANPDSSVSFQFSRGFIRSPEALEPDINIVRYTASIIHTVRFNHNEFISSSLVFGDNQLNVTGKNLQSALLESNLKLKPITIYMRYEFVQKDADELQLLSIVNRDYTYGINAFTVGVNRILFTRFNTDVSLGLQGTINFSDTRLHTIYGEMPLAAEVYLKIAPAISK